MFGLTWRNVVREAHTRLTWRNLEGYPAQPGFTWRNRRLPSPTRINLEEPGGLPSPTRINLEKPGGLSSQTRINLEEP